MTISFLGGPYDGMRLGVVEIQRCLVILTVPGRRGPRRFAYLPDPADWPDVLAGRMRAADSAASHYYELINTARGLEFRSDSGGRRAAEGRAIGADRAAPDGDGRRDDAAT